MLPLLALYFIVQTRMPEPATVKELLLIVAMLSLTMLHPHEWFGKCLELLPVRWVGKMSYSLYI